MADNQAFYGFRWSKGYNSKPQPQPEEMFVASGQNFNISGSAVNWNLNVGDLVTILATGGITVAGGNENAAASVAVYGVVVGFGSQGFFNTSIQRMQRGLNLPSGVVYGTNVDRQSKVLVVPASAGYWEADLDGAAGAIATTLFGYQAFIGENIDHQNTGNAATLALTPKLNAASHAAPFTAGAWRIQGVSQNFSNQDFSGANVKLVVTVNKGQEPFYTNSGI